MLANPACRIHINITFLSKMLYKYGHKTGLYKVFSTAQKSTIKIQSVYEYQAV